MHHMLLLEDFSPSGTRWAGCGALWSPAFIAVYMGPCRPAASPVPSYLRDSRWNSYSVAMAGDPLVNFLVIPTNS